MPDDISNDEKSIKKDLIGSVQRALGILELLAREPEGLNAKEISIKRTLNLSTCYHLINTLLHEGYVVKDPSNGQYRLSSKIGFTSLKQASPAQLTHQLSPYVKDLMTVTDETAYLSVWDGQNISVACIFTAENTIQVKSVAVGYSEGNHASALGKTILANLPEETADLYFSKRVLQAYSPNTLTCISRLKENFKKIRVQGYGTDREEFMAGVKCIAAPVFDAQGDVTAAIAVSLPVMRYENRSEFLQLKVLQMAESASRALSLTGYNGPARAGETVA